VLVKISFPALSFREKLVIYHCFSECFVTRDIGSIQKWGAHAFTGTLTSNESNSLSYKFRAY